jgi:hypothetical protein
MNVSSVSPDLWLVITPQPAALDIFTASMDSDTVPIWLTYRPATQATTNTKTSEAQHPRHSTERTAVQNRR